MKLIIAISWTVIVGAALIVFIFKGLFTPVAYQFSISGGNHAYAPAWFSMNIVPMTYGFMLYIINRYEKRMERVRIGITLGSIVVVLLQTLLMWTAIFNN